MKIRWEKAAPLCVMRRLYALRPRSSGLALPPPYSSLSATRFIQIGHTWCICARRQLCSWERGKMSPVLQEEKKSPVLMKCSLIFNHLGIDSTDFAKLLGWNTFTPGPRILTRVGQTEFSGCWKGLTTFSQLPHQPSDFRSGLDRSTRGVCVDSGSDVLKWPASLLHSANSPRGGYSPWGHRQSGTTEWLSSAKAKW